MTTDRERAEDLILNMGVAGDKYSAVPVIKDFIDTIRAEGADEVDKVREVWDAEIEAERKRCAGITDKAAITQIATWIACLTASSNNMLDLAARIRKGENQR